MMTTLRLSSFAYRIPFCNGNGVLIAGLAVNGHLDLFAQHFELINSGRAVNVAGNQ